MTSIANPGLEGIPEVIYFVETAESVLERAQEIVEHLQRFSSPSNTRANAFQRETVARILELFSLSLPVCDEEDSEEEEEIGPEDISSSSEESDEVEDSDNDIDNDEDLRVEKGATELANARTENFGNWRSPSDGKVMPNVPEKVPILEEDCDSRGHEEVQEPVSMNVDETLIENFHMLDIARNQEGDDSGIDVLQAPECPLGSSSNVESEVANSFLDFPREYSEPLDLESVTITSISHVPELPTTASSQSQVNQVNDVELTDFIDEEELWARFIEDLKSGLEINEVDDSESNDPSYQMDYPESESESDLSSEDEVDEYRNCNEHGQIATYPYPDSDSESDEASSSLDQKIFPRLPFLPVIREETEIEVITLDDDDEDVTDNVNEAEMSCNRCPATKKKFADKGFFLLHTTRHAGKDHFICPTCSKPFTKISFCLAHEVRVHQGSFTYDHPRIAEAKIYLQQKREKEALKQNPISAERNVVDVEEVNIESLSDDEQGPNQSDVETDEDDPKFYPDHIVPSTTLYPYRGPKLTATCESYEVQLKFGRKKRTGVNTIAHVVLACRQQLINEGRIPDLGNRFWNFPSSNNRKPGEVKLIPINPNKRKRSRLGSNSSQETNPSRRKRKKLDYHKRKTNITDRTFVSTYVHHVCLLCNYVWKDEADLRQHRDEKHPTKKILHLMTVPKPAVSEDEDDDDPTVEVVLFKKGKAKGKNKHSERNAGASRVEMSKESFLNALGLVSVRKLALRKRKIKSSTKPCYVRVERLRRKNMTRSGRVFLCNLCEYFNRSRDLVNLHKTKEHPFEGHLFKPKQKLNILPKKKNRADHNNIMPIDVVSIASSTSSHGYDDSEETNSRSSKKTDKVKRGPSSSTSTSTTSSSTSSSFSATRFIFK